METLGYGLGPMKSAALVRGQDMVHMIVDGLDIKAIDLEMQKIARIRTFGERGRFLAREVDGRREEKGEGILVIWEDSTQNKLLDKERKPDINGWLFWIHDVPNRWWVEDG